ncbi:hypothetical protein FVW20_15800, partial [Desulfovibrio oxamicus]|nr:hypothetical protein [Nitratidesulfovibrio oxamicus]
FLAGRVVAQHHEGHAVVAETVADDVAAGQHHRIEGHGRKLGMGIMGVIGTVGIGGGMGCAPGGVGPVAVVEPRAGLGGMVR